MESTSSQTRDGAPRAVCTPNKFRLDGALAMALGGSHVATVAPLPAQACSGWSRPTDSLPLINILVRLDIERLRAG